MLVKNFQNIIYFSVHCQFVAEKLVLVLQISDATAKIAARFEITGPFNIQFLVKENDVKVWFTC